MDSHDSPSPRPSQPPTRDQQNAKARAASHRDSLHRRARRIRRSVASLTAVLFSTAFLVIYVQLASGHDPALVANAKRAASTSTTTSSSKASTSTERSTSESTGSSSEGSSESTGSSSTESTSSSEEPRSGTSAVTTSQS